MGLKELKAKERKRTTEMKIIEGHKLEQFGTWEGRTLEIWSKQTTKKPWKINVSNDYDF